MKYRGILSLLAVIAIFCALSATKLPKSVKVKYPEGMVYVPSGAFDMETGSSAQIQSIQLAGFYMDANEVSNIDYREFVDYVRDSIAHVLLGDFKDLPDGSQTIDWKRINFKDPEVQDKLAALYLPAELSGTGKKQLDATKLVYRFTVFNFKEAAKHPNEPQIKYINRYYVPIYPDTLVWLKLFHYQYNDPQGLQYFTFRGFSDYPVVGVNWMKCYAYCDWRSMMFGKKRNKHFEGRFRLPTEAEWEWAAKGGSKKVLHIIIADRNGLTPQHKNYSANGGFYTFPADDNGANDYGLANMDGNVSEWTASGDGDIQDNQEIGNPANFLENNKNGKSYLNNKVVRGGNWMDDAKNQQYNARELLHYDSSNAYTGFRCVYTGIMANK